MIQTRNLYRVGDDQAQTLHVVAWDKSERQELVHR
jgi:hypothetical protein